MTEPAESDDKFEEVAQRLRKLLDGAEAKNKKYLQDIAAAEAREQDAKARAIQAESRAAETQKRLDVLEDLSNDRYQKVVSDLFRKPSLQAAALTVIVAIASIVIGMRQTSVASRETAALYQQLNREAIENNSKAIADLAALLKEQMANNVSTSESRTREEIQRTRDDLKAMIKVMTDPDLREGGLTELQRNVAVDAAVGQNANRYFRLLLPPGAAPLKVTLTPIGGNPDMFIGYERVPRPNSSFDCSFPQPGMSPESCYWVRPPAGQYVIRIFGTATGASFRLVADYSVAAKPAAPAPKPKAPR